jgi:hypothetical protein
VKGPPAATRVFLTRAEGSFVPWNDLLED